MLPQACKPVTPRRRRTSAEVLEAKGIGELALNVPKGKEAADKTQGDCVEIVMWIERPSGR
jgi:hypothetical protein